MTTGSTPEFRAVLTQAEWQQAKEAQLASVAPWAKAHVARFSRAERHPVFDFLFEYYTFRPAHLMRFSPGTDVLLQDTTTAEVDWPEDYQTLAGGISIPANRFPKHRLAYLEWGARYLKAVSERTPSFCCFGLHEWAMVYKIDQPRHAKQPLRLPAKEIEEIVEAGELRCTHFDAFRFFTPEAVPLNRNQLTRAVTIDHDQRGCIHANMDLYRFAYKIAPWCPSSLIADTFLLAKESRIVDMRASPYDLAHLGFEPIKIETVEGRDQYIQEQRRLADLAQPLRLELLKIYEHILRRIDHSRLHSESATAS